MPESTLRIQFDFDDAGDKFREFIRRTIVEAVRSRAEAATDSSLPPAATADHPIHELLDALTSEGALTEEAARDLTQRYYRAIRSRHPAGDQGEIRAAALRDAIHTARSEGHRLEAEQGIEAARGARSVAFLLRQLIASEQPATEHQEQPAAVDWEDIARRRSTETSQWRDRAQQAETALSRVRELTKRWGSRTDQLRVAADHLRMALDEQTDDQEQGAAVDWEAVARQRETERDTAIKAFNAVTLQLEVTQAEAKRLALMVDEYGQGASQLTDKVTRVRDRQAEWAVTGEQPDAYITFADAASVLLEDLDGPKPTPLPEGPPCIPDHSVGVHCPGCAADA